MIPKEEAVEARGKELTNVLQAILKERKFNGKSIEWDGIHIMLVRDELDDKNILDGRSGLFEVKEIDTATGITLYSFSTPNNEDLFSDGFLPVVDNPEEYMLKSSNRYLSLKKQDITNYDALAKESSEDTQLIELDGRSLKTSRTCKLYTGIIQTESGDDLIGFRFLTKVKGKSAVCLTYAGTGNYSVPRPNYRAIP